MPLFIVYPEDSEFKLENYKHYSIKEKNYRIERWTDEGLVYEDISCGIKSLNS